jgi:8-oxo-dGTP diphosphatase
MEKLQELQEFLSKGHLQYWPNLTVECAIFGYREGELQLLLLKNKIITAWCLPAGYVKKKESLDDAAIRITSERTGIKTFGNPGRNNPHGVFNQEKLFETTGIRIDENNWLAGDTISIGYYAVTDIVQTNPCVDFMSSECCWFPVNELPKLGFDHDEIAQEALSAMRMHLNHFPIGKNLLPQRFTLKEIKLFYEVMSGKKLNATNFPNKLISIGLIIKLDEKKNIGAHRSPTYYKFDEERYEKAIKEGLVLV